MEAATTEKLYVRWDADLQASFDELVRRQGFTVAALMLDMPEANLRDLQNGVSRAGYKGGQKVPRKFLSTETLSRLAVALDDPMIEDREGLTQREWSDRGDWLYRSAG